jgi:hypothetical protein
METLLASEAEFWEDQLSSRMQKLVSSNDVLEKERLRIQIEWKTNCRQRFDGDIQAMDARLRTAKLAANGSDELLKKWQDAHDNIERTWRSVLKRVTENSEPPSSSTNLSHLASLQTPFQQRAQAIEAIIQSSPLNATSLEQLQQQSVRASNLAAELKQAIFCMDHPAVYLTRLTEFQSSRSNLKWADLSSSTESLGVYTRALRAMNAVLIVTPGYIGSQLQPTYYTDLAKLVHDLPSVTSIHVQNSTFLSTTLQDLRDPPLFINDHVGSNKIETFLDKYQSRLARTRHTLVYIDTGSFRPVTYPASWLLLSPGAKIAVSFFGPSSGNLVLKLTHRAPSSSSYDPETPILQWSHGSHTHTCKVPSSVTVENITLFPSHSDTLSFVQGTQNTFVECTQNNLIIEVINNDYMIQDIQLQDDRRNAYNGVSLEV